MASSTLGGAASELCIDYGLNHWVELLWKEYVPNQEVVRITYVPCTLAMDTAPTLVHRARDLRTAFDTEPSEG